MVAEAVETGHRDHVVAESPWPTGVALSAFQQLRRPDSSSVSPPSEPMTREARDLPTLRGLCWIRKRGPLIRTNSARMWGGFPSQFAGWCGKELTSPFSVFLHEVVAWPTVPWVRAEARFWQRIAIRVAHQHTVPLEKRRPKSTGTNALVAQYSTRVNAGKHIL